MAERRVSGWFLLSALFIVMVFGLFFTFTERKTWPEHRVELGPMDMRLVPPVSTLWCEAVALYSEHSFIAYQVNHSTRINPLRLNSQAVNLKMKLRGTWSTNYAKFKYFLLPSSVMGIVACSSSPFVKLLIFKGNLDVQSCLQYLGYKEFSKSNNDISHSESTENSGDFGYEEESLLSGMAYEKTCSSLLHYHSIESTYIDNYSMDCTPLTESRPVKVNITSADDYVIVVWNTNRHVINYVNLQVMLDRTRYVVHTSGQTLDICSLSNSCTIGLGFASGDRVLVSIPEEPNAGRASFIVRSRCKPRLAIFAVLSVFLPLVLFLAVAFVVRADRDAFGRFLCKDRNLNNGLPNRPRIIAPLLDDRNAGSFESFPEAGTQTDAASVQVDDRPPPYHMVYDPPPPYACVKKLANSNPTQTS